VLELALGAAGADVWDDLRPAASLDELAPGSFELLPLLYERVASFDAADPMLSMLKGVYRRTWVKNNVLLDHTKAIGRVLRDASISALFVEGPVLAARFYRVLGLRPTASIDVVLRPEDIGDAVNSLAASGWQEQTEWGSAQGDLRYIVMNDRSVCSLRTRVAPDFVLPGREFSTLEPFFASGERILLGDVEVDVPNATDTLLAVCVAHARAEPLPNLQWLVDAKMILRLELDWDGLLEIGLERSQGRRLRDVLTCLKGLPGPEPPAAAIARLDVAKASGRERVAYALASKSFSRARALPSIVSEHLAVTARETWPRVVLSFPRRVRARRSLARRHTEA